MKIPPTNSSDLSGKKVLVRVDFNVPVTDGRVDDDYRIQMTLPLIRSLRQSGAKIILMSHRSKDESLEQVSRYLQDTVPHRFIKSWDIDLVRKQTESLQEGQVLLLENLRLHNGEKENDDSFSTWLAGLADVYINEAFSASHREHASIVGVPKYIEHYAGPQFVREVRELSRTFSCTEKMLVILGGAKVKTKLPLVTKFISKAQAIAVMGALAHDVLKEMGVEIGTSLVSDDVGDLEILLNSNKILLPSDAVVVSHGERERREIHSVQSGDMIMDAGDKTIDLIKEQISVADFILWNGPLGNFEKGFRKGTEEVARAISTSSAVSIVGGGDTQSAIRGLGLGHGFTFVSTGGGAMLSFLADETLPGIEALGEK